MSAPVNHLMLDDIDNAISAYCEFAFVDWKQWERLSECIKFQDEDGRWYEIVVRPIEEPDDVEIV